MSKTVGYDRDCLKKHSEIKLKEQMPTPVQKRAVTMLFMRRYFLFFFSFLRFKTGNGRTVGKSDKPVPFRF